MSKLIHVEDVSFEEYLLKDSLKNMDENVSYNIETLIYYPYLFHEFKVDNKSLLNRVGKKAGCTIDGINKLGALIDQPPKILTDNINERVIMKRSINNQNAITAAKTFLMESISSRMKIFKMPRLILMDQQEFYRPYWVVRGKSSIKNTFYLTVDAVTGKYHPL